MGKRQAERKVKSCQLRSRQTWLYRFSMAQRHDFISPQKRREFPLSLTIKSRFHCHISWSREEASCWRAALLPTFSLPDLLARPGQYLRMCYFLAPRGPVAQQEVANLRQKCLRGCLRAEARGFPKEDAEKTLKNLDGTCFVCRHKTGPELATPFCWFSFAVLQVPCILLRTVLSTLTHLWAMPHYWLAGQGRYAHQCDSVKYAMKIAVLVTFLLLSRIPLAETT